MLVISKYVLDCKPYHASARYVSWETCTLRYWLKFSFIHDAFTDEEKEMIPTVTTYSTSVDRSNYESRDRVFLLSTPEANEYFDSDSARICQPTDFAIANGVYTTENANSCWWSRSIAQEAISAAYVDSAGRLARYGYKFSRDDIGVRPAIWIDISSLG